MHTIEASVLVPLGLGIIVVLMTVSFCLHDQVVLSAECAALMLEWQHGDVVEADEGLIEAELTGRSLITDISCTDFFAGKIWCRLEVAESRRLFGRGLARLAMGDSAAEPPDENVETKTFSLIKIDPCWLKRIWRVSGIE